MTLDQACIGEPIIIDHIMDPDTALLAMRLGLCEGETVALTSRIPGGPLVVRKGNTEIALGQAFCRHIRVSYPNNRVSP